MKNIPLLVATLVGTLALVVGVAFLFSRSEQPVIADVATLIKSDSIVKGPDSAKVTIVEFSDLQCPACSSAHPIVKSIMTKYPNDVRVVFRHYPILQLHPLARRAAEATEAVVPTGKVWDFIDLLFAEQSNWTNLDASAFNQKLEEYAAKIEIDKAQFKQRIDSQVVRDKVSGDLADGDRIRIPGTPTFFVNNQQTPAQNLQTTVESLLK